MTQPILSFPAASAISAAALLQMSKARHLPCHQLDGVLPAAPPPSALRPDLEGDYAGQEDEGRQAQQQLADAQLQQGPSEAREFLVLCESCGHRGHKREERLGWIEALDTRRFGTSLDRSKSARCVRLRGHDGYTCHAVQCH